MSLLKSNSLRWFRYSKLKTISLVLLISFIIFSLFINVFAPQTYRQIRVTLINDLSCYRENLTVSLPDILEDDPPKGRSVFFHETSCQSKENGRITITARQACAVESAARLNPNYRIYLLYTSPGAIKGENNRNDKIIKQLMMYRNVRIKHLNFKRYLQGSPLETLYENLKIEASSYAMSHASDVLRYLTLWRYGGVYLDLDVILIRSLEKLKPNFAGRESDHAVAAGVISFSHEGDGHVWARQCVEDLKKNFDGSSWGNNGPGVITRLVKKLCGNIEMKNMTREKCKGFSVFPPSTFYPIPWRNWHDYFDANHLTDVLNSLNKTVAIHVWNKHSADLPVSTASQVPYVYLAKKYCPRVFMASEDEF